MTVRSAGLLVYRHGGGADSLQVLLAHMGGPYWQRKDAAAWSIPKGEHDEDEEPLAAARREFTEELGLAPPSGADYVPLGEVMPRKGKIVTAWAVEADFDVQNVVSNTFEMEWPPRSGRRQAFPEVDRADWFGIPVARLKIVQAQLPLLDRLTERLAR
jgi:predicted NUDIX family NTP pyrophosphohydrolase